MHELIQAFVGLLAGLVGGLLGVGGSIIIIPALILYLDQTGGGYRGNQQHLLQAAAMICNVFVAAPSILAHWRAKAIMRSIVVWLIPSALVGSLLGVSVSNSSVFARENGAYLAMLLGVFLAYVALFNAWRMFHRENPEARFDPARKIPAWQIVGVGVPMGVIAGLLGVGGGILAVPAQQLILRLPLRNAIANSAATIVFAAAIGAIYKNATLPSHGVAIAESLRLAVMIVPTAMLGSYLGGRLTHVLPRRALQLVFIVFMGAIAYLTFAKAWNAARMEERSLRDAPAAVSRRLL
jgi:uncharacterized membrane protein YfcA